MWKEVFKCALRLLHEAEAPNWKKLNHNDKMMLYTQHAAVYKHCSFVGDPSLHLMKKNEEANLVHIILISSCMIAAWFAFSSPQTSFLL